MRARRTKRVRPRLLKVKRMEAAPAEGHAVGVLEVDAKRFVTLGPEHPWWSQLAGGAISAGGAMGGDGAAFVRLRPPKGASKELVAAVEREVRAWGALAVKVEYPKEDATVAKHAEAFHVKPREVVLELARGAKGVRVDLLEPLCESILTEVGL